MKNRIIAVMPRAKVRLPIRLKVLPSDPLWPPGIRGRAMACQMKAIMPIGTTMKKAPRHPTRLPSKLPSGAALTAASARGGGGGRGGDAGDDRRRQGPVAADRHADERAADHEYEVIGGKGDRQA